MNFSSESAGSYCHALAARLWALNRSITGKGVRDTLRQLQLEIPDLELLSVPSGTQVYDWTVPDEWNVEQAYIDDPYGQRIVDFARNNLHLVGYSSAIEQHLTLDELKKHLYSLPDQPTAIPYITSYYSRRWGFCISQQQLEALLPGTYYVRVDATLAPGQLDYAELLIKGREEREIFLSTYVCHPSMANNELSGPVVATAIARWLASENRRYSYRIVFAPETIGAITYISKNYEVLRNQVFAAFNLTCLGDEKAYSYVPSRQGDTIADRVAKHVLKHIDPNYKQFSWLDRGSDERQYCAPGVDLPMATITRSKYGEFPEYHTSLDNLNFVTPKGLQGGFDAVRAAIEAIEADCNPIVRVRCEPQLGKRGLYPTLSTKTSGTEVRRMMNLISYCDGSKSLLDIAEILDEPVSALAAILDTLKKHDLITFE